MDYKLLITLLSPIIVSIIGIVVRLEISIAVQRNRLDNIEKNQCQFQTQITEALASINNKLDNFILTNINKKS
jgi:DNA-binding IscR family transcriptional regulator